MTTSQPRISLEQSVSRYITNGAFDFADCGIVCHSRCVDSLPNNCGLPPQLADHVLSQLPASKRPRREGRPGGGQSPDGDGATSSEHVDHPDESRDGEEGRGAAEKKREGSRRQEEATKRRKVLKAGTPKASDVSSSSGQTGSKGDRKEKTRAEGPLKIEKVHVPKLVTASTGLVPRSHSWHFSNCMDCGRGYVEIQLGILL